MLNTTTALRRQQHPLRGLLAAILLLNVADWLLTAYVLPAVGIAEGNPLAQLLMHGSPLDWPLLAVKLALMAALSVWAVWGYPVAPRLVRLGLLCALTLSAAVVYWNLLDVLGAILAQHLM